MVEVTPLSSLIFFEEHLPSFLKADGEIHALLSLLKRFLKDSNSADFNANVLDAGKNVIKRIISKSIEYLSDEGPVPKNRSITKIDKYIDAFTLFEEMLFGLDRNYRDHTLHSLWVYLFGHEFITRLGGYDRMLIAGQTSIVYDQPKLSLFAPSIEVTTAHLEAMWGMIAILHDLGYPVEVISSRPHEVFGAILDPFAIDSSSVLQIDIGARISILHQGICEVLATSYWPEALSSEEMEGWRSKEEEGPIMLQRQPTTRRDKGIEVEFEIASVDKIHSAWSAILAFRNIDYLHADDHSWFDRDFRLMLTKRDILYSIVHHTSEEPTDLVVNRFQFILLLMDDMEEALRYSRGGRERGIAAEDCKMSWCVGESKTSIQLDYGEKKEKLGLKYGELSNKYRVQTSRHVVEGRYEIEISLTGDGTIKQLPLNLVKDS